MIFVFSAEAKTAWPNLIELSESMHQLFGHSYEVKYFILRLLVEIILICPCQLIEKNNMHGLKRLYEENTVIVLDKFFHLLMF